MQKREKQRFKTNRDFLPGTGVAGLDGGPETFNWPFPTPSGVASVPFIAGAFLPGFDTIRVTRPSVLFNKPAAYEKFQEYHPKGQYLYQTSVNWTSNLLDGDRSLFHLVFILIRLQNEW